MSNRAKEEPPAAEQVRRIEQRQQQLLDDLDRLNGQIEMALADFAPKQSDATPK